MNIQECASAVHQYVSSCGMAPSFILTGHFALLLHFDGQYETKTYLNVWMAREFRESILQVRTKGTIHKSDYNLAVQVLRQDTRQPHSLKYARFLTQKSFLRSQRMVRRASAEYIASIPSQQVHPAGAFYTETGVFFQCIDKSGIEDIVDRWYNSFFPPHQSFDEPSKDKENPYGNEYGGFERES